MGSVIGGITDAIGLTDHSGAADAAAASSAAADRSYALTTEEIDFQREQYYDWKDTYGDLQDQLDIYYQNYDGEDLVTARLGEVSSEFQTAEKDLTRNLSQRGLSGSGAEALGLTTLASQEASTKATVRNSQEEIAEQKRLAFLGLGLGQGTDMLGINAQVSNSGAGNATSISNAQSSLYGSLSQANMAATSDAVEGAAGFASGKGWI